MFPRTTSQSQNCPSTISSGKPASWDYWRIAGLERNFFKDLSASCPEGMQLFSTQSVGEEIDHYTTPGALPLGLIFVIAEVLYSFRGTVVSRARNLGESKTLHITLMKATYETYPQHIINEHIMNVARLHSQHVLGELPGTEQLLLLVSRSDTECYMLAWTEFPRLFREVLKRCEEKSTSHKKVGESTEYSEDQADYRWYRGDTFVNQS